MTINEVKTFGEVTGIKLGYSPIGKPLMSVYCYFLDGLLIDTASANVSFLLIDHVKSLQVNQVALTHFHEDHSGNARLLQRMNIPVYGSQKTVAQMTQRLKLKPYEIFMWGVPPTAKLQVLPEKVRTPKYTLEPISTTGHCDGHVIYFEARQGWIFSGDLFLGPKIKYFRKDEDIFETILSLKKILQLDFDTVFCGHNPKLKTGKIFLQKKFDYLCEFYMSVEDRLQRGESSKKITKELVSKNENYLAKLITLGDVCFKNMLVSTIDCIQRGNRFN